jgi:hypothetical protein
MESLTQEERNLVVRYLQSESKSKDAVWYVAFIAPTALWFAYGAYSHNPRAMAAGYISLIALIIWYLRYAKRNTKHLISALRKYEEATCATALHQGDA